MRTAHRVSVSLHVDPDDHKRLVERARSEDRSLSAALRVAIREYLGRPETSRRDDQTKEEERRA
jgi:hypothetical protein